MATVPSTAYSKQQSIRIWVAIAAILAALYLICLRFLFPGYLAPLSAFHVDAFEYASLRDKTIEQILRYPRPAAYYAMKILGLGGLQWVMFNGIAVALASVWLTVLFVQRVSRIPLFALPLPAALYFLLLFAHPDFYFEHRHDLPAEVSYLFAMASLLAWGQFVEWRGRWAGLGMLFLAVAAAVFFVFSKETYFGSALCLIFGIALIDRKNWKWHAGYLLFLIALEAAAFLWTAHLNGPFVNTRAAANNPYRIDARPAVLANTAWFYLSHFLNPFLVGILAWTLFILRREKDHLILACTLLAGGMAALGPHALLPNHLLEEYAWAAAPLVFAPLLLAGGELWPWNWRSAVTTLAILLTLWAPGGYRTGYKSPELVFNVEQDRIGRHIARAVPKLHAIPDGSRALVVGLEATYVPFYIESFMLTEFGEHIAWTVVSGPQTPGRRENRVTRIIAIPQVQLDSYEELVSFDADGQLLSIRKVRDIPAEEREKPYLLVPELKPFAELVESNPKEVYRKFLAANVCLNWGLWDEAQRYLDAAAALGASQDSTYIQLMSRLGEGRRTAAPPAPVSTLIAQPARLADLDGSGLVEAELVWTIVPPRPCEIHIGAPDGKLFAVAATSGAAKTGRWVTNGMTFYLQDVSGGRTLTTENTVAKVAIEVTPR